MEFDEYKSLIIRLLFSLIICLFSFITIDIYLKKRKYSHIPGPPTKGILGFYLGHVLTIKNARKNNKSIVDLIENWSKEYKNVLKLQMFLGRHVIITWDQNAIKEIFIIKNFPKYDIMYKKFAFPFNERFGGNGLFGITDDEKWRHNRRLLNPAFHKQVLMQSIDEFNIKGDILLEKIRSFADGKKEINFLKEFNQATLDIIASVAFRMNTNCIHDENNNLNKYNSDGLKGLQKLLDDPLIMFNPFNWNFINEYKQTLRKLRAIGREQIQSRIKLLQEGFEIPNDLLTTILKAREDECFDIEELVDEFVTFFIAGQETTSNALAFCILELLKNPDAFEKVREELDQVFGSRNEIKFDDLSKLNYTSCVIKETLRLWPPGPGVFRTNTEEFLINGYKIPTNSNLLISIYAVARQEENFEEPLKFKPERFLEKAQDSNKNYTYLPFSLGPRNCIGQNFAQIEMKVILSKLVKNYDLELVPGQELGSKLTFTLRPKTDVHCYVKQRTI